MPELVGAAILASAGIADTALVTVGAATLTLSTVVGSLTLTGAAIGLQALAGPSPQTGKIAAQQRSLKQAIFSRTLGFGRFVVAGGKVVWDSKNGIFYDGYYHCEGPIDAIEEWWLDDVITTITGTGGNSGVAPWQNFVGVQSLFGTVPQTAMATLVSELGTYWDADHRLDGCCYSLVRSVAPPEKQFRTNFPSGAPPSLRVKMRGAKVRDVQDSGQTTDPATWVWSDRAGPIIYSFLVHKFGLRVPQELMNTASWSAFNALCNENIVDKFGTTFPRYYMGGVHQVADDDPADTLQAMLDACDGRLTLEPDGTIGITGGQLPTPTLTFTDEGVISRQIEAGNGLQATFNILKTTFVSPANEYQQIDGPIWRDQNYDFGDPDAEDLEQAFDRPWAQGSNQLQRLAKIFTAKKNPAIKITGMVCDMSWAPCLFEEAVTITSARYGFDEIFIIDRPVANIARGTVTLDVYSLRSDAYDFDASTEEQDPPLATVGRSTSDAPPDPTGVVVDVERRSVDGGTFATFLRITCDDPSRDDLHLIGRYRKVGDTNYTDAVADSDNRFSVLSSVLEDGANYEPQGALSAYFQGATSNWVDASPSPITAVADDVAPDPPYGTSASPSGGGYADLVWFMPGSDNVHDVVVKRGTTTTYASSTNIDIVNGSPNQRFEIPDSAVTIGLTYYYWFVARNGSGIASTPDGPHSVTIT